MIGKFAHDALAMVKMYLSQLSSCSIFIYLM